MGLKSGPAAKGKAIHESKPTSKLSSQKYITKPENRHPNTHNYTVGQAESKIRGLK